MPIFSPPMFILEVCYFLWVCLFTVLVNTDHDRVATSIRDGTDKFAFYLDKTCTFSHHE